MISHWFSMNESCTPLSRPLFPSVYLSFFPSAIKPKWRALWSKKKLIYINALSRRLPTINVDKHRLRQTWKTGIDHDDPSSPIHCNLLRHHLFIWFIIYSIIFISFFLFYFIIYSIIFIFILVIFFYVIVIFLYFFYYRFN